MEKEYIERTQQALKAQGLSTRTANAYMEWIRRFLIFYADTPPEELGEKEVGIFLDQFFASHQLSASTQNQAFCALQFLFRHVWHHPLSTVNFVRLQKRNRSPVILSENEMQLLLNEMKGVTRLLASLLYGSGLRVQEGIALRIKDIHFDKNYIQSNIHQTLLPISLRNSLREQIQSVTELHARDIAQNGGYVPVSEKGLLTRELGWQYLFPASRLTADPATGLFIRNHLHESVLQKAVRQAIRTMGLTVKVSSHSLRHSFAARLLEAGYDGKTIAKLMGFQDKRALRLYEEVINRVNKTVRSPIDEIE